MKTSVPAITSQIRSTCLRPLRYSQLPATENYIQLPFWPLGHLSLPAAPGCCLSVSSAAQTSLAPSLRQRRAAGGGGDIKTQERTEKSAITSALIILLIVRFLTSSQVLKSTPITPESFKGNKQQRRGWWRSPASHLKAILPQDLSS